MKAKKIPNSVSCASEIIDYIEHGGKNLWDAILIIAKHIDSIKDKQ